MNARQAGSLRAIIAIQKAERENDPGIGDAKSHDDRQHCGSCHHEAATDDHDHTPAVIVGNRADEDRQKEGRQGRGRLHQCDHQIRG